MASSVAFLTAKHLETVLVNKFNRINELGAQVPINLEGKLPTIHTGLKEFCVAFSRRPSLYSRTPSPREAC
jgi:hypothetical protein